MVGFAQVAQSITIADGLVDGLVVLLHQLKAPRRTNRKGQVKWWRCGNGDKEQRKGGLRVSVVVFVPRLRTITPLTMSKSLEGKVAVVTGASSGIGEAIAKVHISL